jgi:hypothetical protein
MPKYTTTEYVAISGLVLAAYGAVLSTINSIVQIATQRKDRADVLVKVQRNMVRTDRMNQKNTIVTAINRGKRPITIQGFAARQLDVNTNLLFIDVRPQVPHVLNETESISAWIPWVDDSDDLSNVETFFVYDNLGREVKHHVVPWYRRVESTYRRRHAADRTKN